MPQPKAYKPQPKVSLEDRIKQVAAKSAPSLMPQELKEEEEPEPIAPPERGLVQLPQIADLVPDRKVSLELSKKAWRLGEIARAKSALSREEKPLKAWVKNIAGKYQIGEAETGDWILKYYASPRATIKEDFLIKALLSRGWQPKDITQLLKEATSYSNGFTLKVSPAGSKEIEEGEEGED